MPKLAPHLTPDATLPAAGLLVGRVWNPAADGPCIVRVDGGALTDITAAFPTMRDLCEAPDPAAAP
jgi:fumarylacetoacetate (FAA) hydrolase family protein